MNAFGHDHVSTAGYRREAEAGSGRASETGAKRAERWYSESKTGNTAYARMLSIPQASAYAACAIWIWTLSLTLACGGVPHDGAVRPYSVRCPRQCERKIFVAVQQGLCKSARES